MVSVGTGAVVAPNDDTAADKINSINTDSFVLILVSIEPSSASLEETTELDINFFVNTQRWLARLSMSFFIIAAVLFWEIYKISQGYRGTVPAWRIGLYLVGIVLGVGLGILGVRARHRSDDPPV